MFEVDAAAYAEMLGLAYDEYPLEACGLLAGPSAADGRPGDVGRAFFRCRNDAASARIYTVNPMDHLRAEREADDRGWEINGVVHSHTHSEPYPSPTDIAAAVSAQWHYVIISLKRDAPEVRSYRIVDGEIVAEPIVVV